MGISKTCDGVSRRDVLRVGALAAGGFSLSNYLSIAHAGQVQTNAKATSAIFINLPGGPSHMDTFDLKPDADDKVRGQFRPIKTNVPGVEFSEHLPKLAQCADKFAILRGVSHTLAAHALGQEYVNTGSRPLPSLEYPGFGSVVSMERPGDHDVPDFVAVPNINQRPGFLGVQYAPLNTNATPQAGQPFSVRGIKLSNGMTVDQVRRRQDLLSSLDQRLASIEKSSSLLQGLDRFSEQAYSMITSTRTRQAFDISKESDNITKMFDDQSFSQSCMLATRLVESGVRFVGLTLGGWDTHTDNWTRLKERQLPQLDAGLSGLLNSLAAKGLLESTAVFVTGEFGRTPKINTRSAEGGRDHYPRCMFMLMAGGGVRGGQVIGESDDTASAPRHEAITPDDVAASFYYNLGIDPTKEYHTETGRPITLVRDGNVIKQLFS